jgi:hypothetical protein
MSKATIEALRRVNTRDEWKRREKMMTGIFRRRSSKEREKI